MARKDDPRFPPGPIWRRVVQDAEVRMASARWAYFLAAAAAFVATFPLSAWGKGIWSHFIGSVGSATLAFFAVYGVAVLWSYWNYRRSGYKNPYWECAMRAPTNTAELELRWGTLTQDVGVLGHPMCVLKRPDGKIEYLRAAIDRGVAVYDGSGNHRAITNFQLSGDGAYRVRWCSDPLGGGRLIELCRATFVVKNGKLEDAGADYWVVR